MDLPLDREDVLTIMNSMLDLHWKIDQITYFLIGEDDGEEEDESDSA